MKILITGTYGQLGRSLLEAFKAYNFEIILTGRNISSGEDGIRLNIQDPINIKAVLDLHTPDLIIRYIILKI